MTDELRERIVRVLQNCVVKWGGSRDAYCANQDARDALLRELTGPPLCAKNDTLTVWGGTRPRVIPLRCGRELPCPLHDGSAA